MRKKLQHSEKATVASENLKFVYLIHLVIKFSITAFHSATRPFWLQKNTQKIFERCHESCIFKGYTFCISIKSCILNSIQSIGKSLIWINKDYHPKPWSNREGTELLLIEDNKNKQPWFEMSTFYPATETPFFNITADDIAALDKQWP